MTINENVTRFDGRPVIDFNAELGIEDVTDKVYRLRSDWEQEDDFEKKLKQVVPESKKGFFNKLLSSDAEKGTPDASRSAGGQSQFASAFQELFWTFVSDPKASEVTALVIGDF